MDGKYFYELMQDQLTNADKRVLLSTLTPEQKLLYTRYGNKIRQQKFNAKPEKKEEYNNKRKEYIAEQRAQKPEIFQERNVKDVRAYRSRNKAKEQELNNKVKAVNTLTDVIRARKARKEMEALKKIKEQKAEEEKQKKEAKKKVGRPRKPRNPVGRPPKKSN